MFTQVMIAADGQAAAWENTHLKLNLNIFAPFWGIDFMSDLFLHSNSEQIKKEWYSYLLGEQCDLWVSECGRKIQLWRGECSAKAFQEMLDVL